MKVNILEFDSDGNSEVIATFKLDKNGKAICDNSLFLNEAKNGMYCARRDKLVKLDDGINFLKELKYIYSGSRIGATDVIK